MEHARIAWLIYKHQKSELTTDEERELNQWLDTSPKNREHFNKVTSPEWFGQILELMLTIDVRAARRKVYRMIRRKKRRR